MANYSEKLRSDAGEMRTAVAGVLERMRSAPVALRERLEMARAQSNIESMRAAIAAAVETISPAAAEQRVVTAVAGAVTANVLDAIADLADYFVGSGALKRVSERMREHGELQKAINLASAQGNWDAFDRIIDRIADGFAGGAGGEVLPRRDDSDDGPQGAD